MIWLWVGFYVFVGAWAYYTFYDNPKTVSSAIVATLLWPLIFLWVLYGLAYLLVVNPWHRR